MEARCQNISKNSDCCNFLSTLEPKDCIAAPVVLRNCIAALIPRNTIASKFEVYVMCYAFVFFPVRLLFYLLHFSPGSIFHIFLYYTSFSNYSREFIQISWEPQLRDPTCMKFSHETYGQKCNQCTLPSDDIYKIMLGHMLFQ